MNTCAECRFWTTERDSNGFGECQRTRASYFERTLDERAVSVPYNSVLRTRSDFGCVQFEVAINHAGGIEPGTYTNGSHIPDHRRAPKA